MTCIAFSDYGRQVAPMLTEQIGANIRTARMARKLSLEKLAAKLGEKHWQTIQKLEKAENAISLEWVERIAKALEVDPNELLAPDLLSRAKEQPRAPQVIRLDEQVATEAASSLAAAALGHPDPDWGTVQAVSLVLKELLVLFSIHPEAATDVRLARPAITLAGQRFGHEAR